MEIKDVINKSLFFLGSGFSRPAGCKMSSEMLDDIRTRIQSKTDNVFSKIEKEGLSFLLSCLSYHCEWRSIQSGGKFIFYPNIEELILLMRRIRDRENYLPYPVTGSWADKLIQLETEFNSWALKNDSEINDLFSSIESKIKKKLLIQWLKFEKTNLSYIDPLKHFLQSYPHDKFCFDIFSLNYDQIWENYFAETGLWMGFSNSKWIGLDSAPELEAEKRRINLYKLHGSLNWIRDLAGDVFEKEIWENQVRDESEEKDEQILQDPYIIFGQGIKTFSVEPFFSLIYHFKKLLREKEYFFVIGYSFFDPYINNLLVSATMGTNKKIILINPKFGPDEIHMEIVKKVKNASQSGQNQFNECQFPEYQQILAVYIKEIQKNSFYSELPEYNLDFVKPDSLFYIPLKTEEFINRYFVDKGSLLKKLIEKFEDEIKKIEQPFE